MAPKQLMFVTLWGVGDKWGWDAEAMQREWPAILDKVASLGYTGVEATVAHVMKFGSTRFLAAMKARNLKWVAQCFSSGPNPPCPGNLDIPSEFGLVHAKDSADTHDVARHCEVWAGQVREALKLREILQSVNSHTGKDYFTSEEVGRARAAIRRQWKRLGARGGPLYRGCDDSRAYLLTLGLLRCLALCYYCVSRTDGRHVFVLPRL